MPDLREELSQTIDELNELSTQFDKVLVSLAKLNSRVKSLELTTQNLKFDMRKCVFSDRIPVLLALVDKEFEDDTLPAELREKYRALFHSSKSS